MNIIRSLKPAFSLIVLMSAVLIGTATYGESPDFLIQDDDVVRGDPKAPITMLEYSDFTCGFCEKFFHETFPKLLSEYIETGKVRFVYRDFPRGIGSPLRAADAARCAGEQHAYWPMHDRLFNSGGRLAQDDLKQYAKELKLNGEQFSACMAAHRYMQDIEKDLRDAGSLGIRGTPAFVLFPTKVPENPHLILIPGAFPYETFKEEIDKLLKLHENPLSSMSLPGASSAQIEGA
ncbi:MAG: DsbA family protein [Nitrospirota bacterium]|jgi:protein-disulfide isomerase|nr:DsbA family protein [Nitrospirota bacterium]MDH4359656.1 DsbA family protein [Nitrospirota bacterium]MDH5295628.1 DsbA family protein [Nitrospirota bacterium]